MKQNLCITPKCEKADLQEIELESSLTLKKFFCPKCGRVYGVLTPTGKATQVAPLITASVILSKCLFAVVTGVFSGDHDIELFH